MQTALIQAHNEVRLLAQFFAFAPIIILFWSLVRAYLINEARRRANFRAARALSLEETR